MPVKIKHYTPKKVFFIIAMIMTLLGFISSIVNIDFNTNITNTCNTDNCYIINSSQFISVIVSGIILISMIGFIFGSRRKMDDSF